MSEFPQPLLEGYRSFRDGRLARERARYRSLAEHGQTPKVMVIACCDSRSAPEVVFDAGPGEIFVVRNVANLVPPPGSDGACASVMSAVEFAVNGLGVRHIVVLGHSRCGGIDAVLRPRGQPLSPDDFVGAWTRLIGPALRETEAAGGGRTARADRQTALERASVRHSVANLRSFAWLSSLEDRGRLGLHGAWFDIASGELWTMHPSTGAFSKAA